MQAAQPLVRDAMSRAILCIDPTMSVADALDLAHEHKVTHLPIVSGGRPLGIVCTCDLEEASVAADVSSIMHAPPAGTKPNQPLEDAAKLMAKLRVGSLLVLSRQALVGIVTRADIERAGLAEQAFGEQRCTACGTFQHVHFNSKKSFWLCASCNRRSLPPPAMHELGGGD
jgi:CBS domain-containing protein